MRLERGEAVAPSIGAVLWLLATAWGAAIASFSLTDNSFLTHLATGRLILESGSVPTVDPYTFTARGVPWTVQSWLPSVLYAGAERISGAAGIHAVVLALTAAAATLLWLTTDRLESLLPRIALVFGSLAIVTGLWGERPYMFGVVAIGLVVLSLQGRLHPGVMVPVYWIWGNSHGSFPLGLGLVVLVLLGQRLDREDTSVTVRVLGWSLLGSVLAAVGPLGIRALLFPATAIERSSLLGQIVEWQPPGFRSVEERAFLVLAAIAIICLVRRPSYARALPVVAFTLAAVVAQRNMVMAVMVLVPAVAQSLPAVGTLRVGDRPRLGWAYVAVGVATVLAAAILAITSPAGDLQQYPTRSLAFGAAHGVPMERLAGQDFVGNLLTALDGEDAAVFVDDRIDMLPAELVDDSLILLRAGQGWSEVLDRRRIDAVVWERDKPLGSLLAADDRWHIVFSDAQWVLACRRSACRPGA